jgi:dipeptidyl-peptidase-3
MKSFMTRDLKIYRQSQRTWVKDLTLKVENIFRFVESYCNSLGIQAEFEELVMILDVKKT